MGLSYSYLDNKTGGKRLILVSPFQRWATETKNEIMVLCFERHQSPSAVYDIQKVMDFLLCRAAPYYIIGHSLQKHPGSDVFYQYKFFYLIKKLHLSHLKPLNSLNIAESFFLLKKKETWLLFCMVKLLKFISGINNSTIASLLCLMYAQCYNSGSTIVLLGKAAKLKQ